MASYIDQYGYYRETLQQIVDNLKTEFRNIYGADLALTDTDPESQMINVFANAIESVQGLLQDWVNAFDIDSSTGNNLSSLLSYRNTKKKDATKSSVDLYITSTSPSMPFPSGLIFTDSLNQRWIVADSFTTDSAGNVTVTAYAPDFGKIEALPNTITTILTPTFGFSTVTNPAAAVVGEDEETDYAVKIRSKNTVFAPSQGIVESIEAAIQNLDGVNSKPLVIENTDNVDISYGAYTVPGHSVGVVAYGGSVIDIAKAIYKYKSAGCGTGIYLSGSLEPNNISTYIKSSNGAPMTVNFSRPQSTGLDVQIELPIGQPLSAASQSEVLSLIADFADRCPIGTEISHVDLVKYLFENTQYFYTKEVLIRETGGAFDKTANPGLIGKFVGSLSSVSYVFS